MDLYKIARKLDGLQTVSTIAKSLNVKARTAINYAWLLRKNGYLASIQNRRVRLYRISPIRKKVTGYSLYELLNENSRVKIIVKEDYFIHSKKKPSIEEILVRCIMTGEFRIVLASLDLFNKVKNWPRLKFFADKYKSGRKIGALYDVARKIIRVRRMDKRTREGLLRNGKERYIIKPFRSKHFKDVEKEWNVYIPFNVQDLGVYKE